MFLSMGSPNVEYTIIRIRGKDEIRKHLASMGFVEGAKVTVISKQGGRLIVNIKNVRLGIDEDLARRIVIE